jgi:hypothetical protein
MSVTVRGFFAVVKCAEVSQVQSEEGGGREKKRDKVITPICTLFLRYWHED